MAIYLGLPYDFKQDLGKRAKGRIEIIDGGKRLKLIDFGGDERVYSRR